MRGSVQLAVPISTAIAPDCSWLARANFVTYTSPFVADVNSSQHTMYSSVVGQ